MAIQINGTSGISGVDGSAATPALQGSDTNTGISFGTDEVNINTGGTAAVTVDSSQRVGIGTTSPGHPLDVVADNSTVALSVRGRSSDNIGSVYFRSNDTASTYGYIQGRSNEFRIATDSSSQPIVFHTNTERMRISANGNILFQPDGNGITIYSFSTGAGTSTVKYNYNTGALTYDASNRYVKDNIVDCPYGIAEIKQLQPRKYFRIDDQINEIGFIADEVSEVMPEFVSMGVKSIATKNPEDTEIVPLAVNYEKMTAVLTKALQEAIGKIETLETRLTALEGGTN